jgi:hypothetical protein
MQSEYDITFSYNLHSSIYRGKFSLYFYIIDSNTSSVKKSVSRDAVGWFCVTLSGGAPSVICHMKSSIWKRNCCVRLDVVMVVIMNIAVFWDETPCYLVDRYQYFG